MEPLFIGEGSRHRGELTDLALELAARSSGFRHRLPDGVLTALADLVRVANSYYSSNLIEGHLTHPVDIERALNDDYSLDLGTRTLQLEARAHVAVQQWIDAGGLRGRATTIDAILSVAAAHHRLLWIHPFLDGNGRVARLVSHAMLLDALDTGAIWSAARGLAQSAAAYKTHLADCDSPRRNDLDGRGHISEEALARFTRFFLETCLDQVTFMEGLVRPDRLRARIFLWAQEETRVAALPPKAGSILEAVLYRGEVPRGEVGNLLGATDRHARRVVAALMERGVLTSEGPRAPLRLAFPAALASRFLPGLFPEQGA